MKRNSAFTLIELLIVVAIIAILAAIAVPNFLEAQVRSKASRAMSDMRSLATAIEAYRVDENSYPVSRNSSTAYWHTSDSNGNTVGKCSAGVAGAAYSICALDPDRGGAYRSTFAVADPQCLRTLTTPVSYITSYPSDPFALTHGLTYGYMQMVNTAWMVWSYGPDSDETSKGTYGQFGGGQVGAGVNPNGSFLKLDGNIAPIAFSMPANFAASDSVPWTWPSVPSGPATSATSGPFNPVYSPSTGKPTATLLTAGYTYDSTNGSKSYGDIWRAKQ
ncbi:TPA: hypothetical protein DDW35_00280 [Candidatus Sumerlaeota bacterium]|jgi:prepilin-type N-terminal cleavage/methylation domain-containing protein|nr:hypothetical protein [Candidatus Sumerlaeota bacterium]